MSISTYNDLVAAIKRWTKFDSLAQEDYEDCVALTEAHMDAALRTQDMSARVSTTTVSGQAWYDQPLDARGVRNIEIDRNSQRRPLEYYTPEALDSRFGMSAAGGVPVAYTVSGNQFELRPCPGGEYTLRITYYQKLPSLSSENPTCWALTRYPQAYLYGGAHFLSDFVRDEEGSAYWGKKFSAAVEAIKSADAEDRWSGSTPAMKAI